MNRLRIPGYGPVVLLCLLCAVVVSARAAATGDLWEDRVQMQMSGMPAGMGGQPQVHQRCSPRKQPTPPMADDSGRCQVTEMQRDAGGMRWAMHCAGDPPMSGRGEMHYQGRDAYTGQWTMDVGGRQISMRMEGRRIGECDADAQAREVADARRQAAAAQAQARDINQLQCRSAVDHLMSRALQPGQPYGCTTADKQRFCARLRSPEGFREVATRANTNTPYGSGSLEEGAAFCGLAAAEVAAPVCESAERDENLDVLAHGCTVRGYGRALVMRECAGRNYSSPPAPKYADFCSAVASQHGIDGVADSAGGGAVAPVAAAAPAPSPTEQALDKGRQLLKGLFGR